MTRYLKITQTDGVRYILRVTRESPRFIVGIEVDSEGDEIMPRGLHPKANLPYHNRERHVDRLAVKKAVEMRMNPTYATLEVIPKRAHATKSAAVLEAEIAEALRAKKWQEQVEREDKERRARITDPGPSPEQLYDEHAADVATGIYHGERRGRAKSFRKIASAAEAIRASETAMRLSDDALLAETHREAAAAHQRAAKLHKSDPAGAEAANRHESAVIHHRQAAKARESRAFNAEDPMQTKKSFAAFQQQLAASKEHGYMAQEYARQALAAARKRA